MALSGALGTGCGSDDDVSSRGDAGFFDAGEGDGGTRDATMEDGTPDAGLGDPLYLLIGAVFTPDGATGYVFPSPDIDGDVEVDLTRTLEIPAAGGGAFAVPDPPTGQVFIGSGESPVIERYGVDADGVFTLEDRISLMPVGWSSIGTTSGITVISPTKAYVFDSTTLTGVEFNPTTMTLVDDFSLSGFEAEEGFSPEFASSVVDGNRILVNVRYFTDSPLTATETRLAVLDTTDNSITYDTQTNCANLLFSVVTDTAIYFSPHANQAYFFAAELSDNSPCAVRVLRGASAYDDDFRLDLNALVEGSAGPLVPGSGTSAYVLRYDETTGGPIGPGSAFLPGWRAIEVDLDGEARVGEVAAFPLTTGAGVGFQVPVEGVMRSYTAIPQFGDAGIESTLLFDVTDPMNVTQAFEAAGFLVSASRVR